MSRILLASASPIRRKLLFNAGLSLRIVPHGIDERTIERDLGRVTASILARELSMAKAIAASRAASAAIVIGADQTLELHGKVLSKPADRTTARKQLQALSAKTHTLHSAFAVAEDGRIVARGVRRAKLSMRRLTDPEIDWYLDEIGDAATTSVGAYQIEGLGIRLFERISGDLFTIQGLPMMPLLAALRRLGALAP